MSITTSGYTPCACRDCMGTTIHGDDRYPVLCDECLDAGCESYNPGNADYDALPAHMRECQRENAYEEA